MIRAYRDYTLGLRKKPMDENLFSQSRLFSLAMGSVLDFLGADRIGTTFFRSKISDFFFGRQRKSLDQSRTNCEQKSLQDGPLLVINGVRTPINGRKINVFHWGYFTLYVELFGTLLLTGDFGPILNFEVPITEVQLLDLCPKNNYYTWQNLCPLLKA